MLYCASAILMVTVAFQVYALVQYGFYGEAEQKIFTTLGLCAIVSGVVAPFVSFAFMFVAAWFWTDFSKSRNILIPGWILGLVLSLWPTVVPLEYMLVESNTVENALTGVVYAMSMLPTYLALIGGLTLGSTRVYKFAPSPLTGAMVVLSAAFGIIIPFAFMALIIQIFGNVLLIVGLLLLISGPFLVVAMGSKFTAVNVFSSSESITFSLRILMIATVLRVAGLFVILAWFITFSKDGIVFITQVVDGERIEGLVSIEWLVSAIFRFIGNKMFQAVLWTDIIVHVARNDNVKIVKLENDLLK